MGQVTSTLEDARAEFYLEKGDLRARFYRDGESVKRIGDLGLTRERALELSIQKWATIVKLTEKGEMVYSDYGRLTCALCGLYYGKDCDGCPVKEHTKLKSCHGTPHEEIEKYMNRKGPISLWLAKEELEFLKNLRETNQEETQ